jgi:hypothetical protein
VAAEAGLDIAASYLARNPTFAAGTTFVDLNNPLVLDTPGIPYEVRITSSSTPPGQLIFPATGKPFVPYTVVSKAREGRTATRTLAATFRIYARDVPFGMFVNGDVDLNGTPNLLRESLLVGGNVLSREKLSQDWNNNNLFDDPDLGWRFHKDLVTSNPPVATCLDTTIGQMVGCAAVYSNFQIYRLNQQKATNEIHALGPSAFPHDRDSHQSVVINNVAQPVVNLPITDTLEAMETLKKTAKAQGLYFDLRNGSNDNTVIQPGDIGAPAKNFAKNVVVYVDADAGDSFGWKVSLIPGSTSSDIKYVNESGQRVGSLSGVIAVRGGRLSLESGLKWSGAIFVPENVFRILGGVTCTCTIFAQGFQAQGGGSTIQLTPEWFQNLPGGVFFVTRQNVIECEPFQPSSVCPAS